MPWTPLQTSMWHLQAMALPKQAAKREEQNDLPGRRATLDSRPQPPPEIRDRSVTAGFIRWRPRVGPKAESTSGSLSGADPDSVGLRSI
jgi:hypothetical protein